MYSSLRNDEPGAMWMLKIHEWALFVCASSSIRKVQENININYKVLWECTGSAWLFMRQALGGSFERGCGKESKQLLQRQKECFFLSRVCWPLVTESLQMNSCPHGWACLTGIKVRLPCEPGMLRKHPMHRDRRWFAGVGRRGKEETSNLRGDHEPIADAHRDLISQI